MARFTDVGLWNLIEHDEVLKRYVGGAFADFRKLEDGVLPDGVAWFRAADGGAHYVSIQEPDNTQACYASMWLNVDDDVVEASSREEAIREIVGMIA